MYANAVSIAGKPQPRKRFTPIGRKVVIYAYKVDETAGGVALPDVAVEKGDWRTPVGLVLAVGPEVKQVKEGQRVLVHPSTPVMKVKYEGDADCVVMEEEHIAGILLEDVS